MWTNGFAYAFKGASYAEMTSNLDLSPAQDGSSSKAFTIETAVDFESDSWATCATPNGVTGLHREVANGPMYWTDSTLGGTALPGGTAASVAISTWNGQYLTAILNGDTRYLIEGTRTNETQLVAGGGQQKVSKGRSPAKWTFGGSTDFYNYNFSTGLFYASRFYNRVLSEEELAWNRKLDDVRFHGKFATNIVVEIESPSNLSVEKFVAAYEVEGIWFLKGVPLIINNETVMPFGYTLETYDSVAGQWVGTTSSRGSEFIFDAASPEWAEKLVRLTWRYSAQGLRVIVR